MQTYVWVRPHHDTMENIDLDHGATVPTIAIEAVARLAAATTALRALKDHGLLTGPEHRHSAKGAFGGKRPDQRR